MFVNNANNSTFYCEVACLHDEIVKGNMAILIDVTKLQEQIERVEKDLLLALHSSTKKLKNYLKALMSFYRYLD